MNRTKIEVVKIGGSLLIRADFVASFRNWLCERRHSNPMNHFVLVAGGGLLVDGLRRYHAANPLGENAAHWLAINLMEVSGRTVASWMPELPVASDWSHLQKLVSRPNASLAIASEFLREHEPDLPGPKLPVGWQATSDSIAARLATCLGGRKLTLLKSVAATAAQQADLKLAASSQLVDPCLPKLAETLVVQIETLPSTAGESSGESLRIDST